MGSTHLDRDALHRLLYRRADHFHRIKIDLTALSEETDVNYFHLSSVLQDMARQGRLKHLSGTRNKAKTYKVEDPALWDGIKMANKQSRRRAAARTQARLV